eukprot:IDg855t1
MSETRSWCSLVSLWACTRMCHSVRLCTSQLSLAGLLLLHTLHLARDPCPLANATGFSFRFSCPARS